MCKIIVILGPNASGKSEFAVKIAKKIGGEIISADSRQVYKGLNIGSGKVEGRWEEIKQKKYFVYKNIIHHCIDFVSLKKIFSAGDFKKYAKKAVNDILSRGKIPIICGGTGFYIDALLENIELSKGEPNWELRRKLEEKSCEELFTELQKLNPKKAEKIDKYNKRRLIRAIEIEIESPWLSHSEEKLFHYAKAKETYDVLYIGIKHPPEILKQRILHRLKERLRNGMISEVYNLHFKKGVSWIRLYNLGLEYRYISECLRKKVKSIEELEKNLNIKIWQYAKRQILWFKRNSKINWISLSEKDFKKSKKLIEIFLTN